MNMPINFSSAWSLPSLAASGGAESLGAERPAGAPRFEDVLLKSLEHVNELDRQSQSMIAGALIGEDYTQAEVFTAVKKADLAFRTMLQIRNKLLDAYNELKNIQM
jgi:flagellar hook-basal body complex protein FliE